MIKNKLTQLCGILIILFSFLLFVPKIEAKDIFPEYINSIRYYGIGVYFAHENMKIYSEPDEKSKIIGLIEYDNSQNGFITFLPDNNIALLSVANENEDWVQVIYNQATGAKGWIKKQNKDDFMTWYQFMQKYGKEKGLYLFRDLPDKYKKAYTEPDEGAQFDKSIFYQTDDIDMVTIKGNWMFAKIIDFDKSVHLGRIRWRDDNGNLLVFPNFDSDSSFKPEKQIMPDLYPE